MPLYVAAELEAQLHEARILLDISEMHVIYVICITSLRSNERQIEVLIKDTHNLYLDQSRARLSLPHFNLRHLYLIHYFHLFSPFNLFLTFRSNAKLIISRYITRMVM